MSNADHILVLTPSFRSGRRAAQDDILRTKESVTINEELLARTDGDFAAGYRMEANEYAMLPASVQNLTRSAWRKLRDLENLL